MHQPQPRTWHFPLPRPHTGVPLADGKTGILVWGDDALHFTIARAGFWDHRGTNRVLEKTTFTEVRRLLEKNDEAGLRKIFENSTLRPRQISGGRLTMRFASGTRPVEAHLDLATGQLKISLSDGGLVEAELLRDEEMLWVKFRSRVEIRLDAAWHLNHVNPLQNLGIPAPESWTWNARASHQGGGFLQQLPEDAPIGVAWRRTRFGLLLAIDLGPNARRNLDRKIQHTHAGEAQKRNRHWWSQYWTDIPALALPDAALQDVYDLGCYKQAGLTPPQAPAATLQGPWMEDDNLPPWSNDYHLNINLQLVYSPAFATNRLEHFKPLWNLLKQWLPLMRRRGQRFFGSSKALLFPHAMDDRGGVIGSFWSGTIDHACTAWMAQMAWQYYRYSMDRRFLRTWVWPLLQGAFEGFWAMRETSHDRLSLPVSVSPELSLGGMRGTWGKNSSFQLAAWHLTADLLQKTAALLGEKADARWERVREELPPYAAVTKDGSRRIGLWEDQDLPSSHRHHSHLASIWPFCTIDPFAGEHKTVVAESLQHWSLCGAGDWAGWSFPWAAQLCLRCDQASAAVLWLKWWEYAFTNEGGGSLHNANFPCVAARNDGALFHPDFQKETPYPWEIMQCDGAMAAVATLLDLLVQQRGDVLHVLPNIPKGWRDFEFDGIRTEGAFLVGATVRGGMVQEVRVRSLAGGPLQLAHGIKGSWVLDEVTSNKSIWIKKTEKGQFHRLIAVPQ